MVTVFIFLFHIKMSDLTTELCPINYPSIALFKSQDKLQIIRDKGVLEFKGKRMVFKQQIKYFLK